MPNSLRVLCAVVFVAVMAGVNEVAHFVVGLGFIPWLLLMVGIFWFGLKIENRDRKMAGEPAYSREDAKQDFRESVPTFIFAGGLVVVVWIITRFI